jgi:hypothetical protein
VGHMGCHGRVQGVGRAVGVQRLLELALCNAVALKFAHVSCHSSACVLCAAGLHVWGTHTAAAGMHSHALPPRVGGAGGLVAA